MSPQQILKPIQFLAIWDLGGQREFVNMLPLVCNNVVAILFMFDLSRKSTLNSVKEWYRQAWGFNKTAIPFLIGTKFDTFATFPRDEQEEITKQAKCFAKAMRASHLLITFLIDKPKDIEEPISIIG